MFVVNPDILLECASNEITKARRVHAGADEVDYIARSLSIMEGFGECIKKLYANAENLHEEAARLMESGNALESISECYRKCERNVVSERSYNPSIHRTDWNWAGRGTQVIPIYRVPQGAGGGNNGVSSTIDTLGSAII